MAMPTRTAYRAELVGAGEVSSRVRSSVTVDNCASAPQRHVTKLVGAADRYRLGWSAMLRAGPGPDHYRSACVFLPLACRPRRRCVDDGVGVDLVVADGQRLTHSVDQDLGLHVAEACLTELFA